MNKYIPIAASFVGGAGLGTGVTYLIVHKLATKKAEERADIEIESVKDTYKLLRKEPPYDEPETAVKAYRERINELGYASEASALAAEEAAVEKVDEALENLEETSREVQQLDDDFEARVAHELMNATPDETEEAPEEDENTVQLRNIFDDARAFVAQTSQEEFGEDRHDPDEFDLLKARDPERPFIISTDFFMENDDEFDKITLTYFDGDDTLTDDREQIIPNPDEYVGAANLTKFGNFSDTASTVYIRNEKMKTDFEVVKEDGSYSEIVLGLKEIDLVRRMRGRKPDDDE